MEFGILLIISILNNNMFQQDAFKETNKSSAETQDFLKPFSNTLLIARIPFPTNVSIKTWSSFAIKYMQILMKPINELTLDYLYSALHFAEIHSL